MQLKIFELSQGQGLTRLVEWNTIAEDQQKIWQTGTVAALGDTAGSNRLSGLFVTCSCNCVMTLYVYCMCKIYLVLCRYLCSIIYSYKLFEQA